MEKLQVVKIGGNVINSKEALQDFLKDFSRVPGHKILVHGGGKKASELSRRLGITPKMTGGRRITDGETLEVVTMVYAGLLNKRIVADLQKNQCNALGLSGADADSIRAHKRVVADTDYGYAGDVDGVASETIKYLVERGVTPVFCAITHDGNGQLLNTNADTIAREIASGMAPHFEVELTYCFEKPGVLRDLEDDDSVIERIDLSLYEELHRQGVISEGMLPKMKNCFEALEAGVNKVVLGLPGLLKDREQKHTSLSL